MAGVEWIKEDFLTCCICTDIYTDPCTLNCQHSFCRHCVTDYIKTRPECIQAKVIPCAFCLQGTPVPDPTRPVADWVKQQRPNLILIGLMDKLLVAKTQSGKGAENCFLCGEVGIETNPATSWCNDCEVALCRRCSVMHCKTSSQRDHVVKDLNERTDNRSKKTLCPEHNMEMTLVCRTCNQFACKKCHRVKHQGCSDVATISSLLPDIKSSLEGKRHTLQALMDKESATDRLEYSNIQTLKHNETMREKDIQKTIDYAIAMLMAKQENLLLEVRSATDMKVARHQIVANSAQNSVQMLKQHLQFIEETLQAQSDVEMYQMYQVCERTDMSQAKRLEPWGTLVDDEIRLVTNFEPLTQAVSELCNVFDEKTKLQTNIVKDLSTLKPIRAEFNTSICVVMPWEDKTNINDVIIMEINGIHILVVADSVNWALDIVDTKRKYTLKLPGEPFKLAKLSEQRVISTVSNCYLVVADVLPKFSLVTAFKTKKQYHGLAVLSDGRLVVGVIKFNQFSLPSSIDILGQDGTVLTSFSSDSKTSSFIRAPNDIYITDDDNIIFTNSHFSLSGESVCCISPHGQIVFTSDVDVDGPHSTSVTTTNSGEILVASQRRVLQLTSDGKYKCDILTSERVVDINNIYVHRDLLYVCQKKCRDIKVYTLK